MKIKAYQLYQKIKLGIAFLLVMVSLLVHANTVTLNFGTTTANNGSGTIVAKANLPTDLIVRLQVTGANGGRTCACTAFNTTTPQPCDSAIPARFTDPVSGNSYKILLKPNQTDILTTQSIESTGTSHTLSSSSLANGTAVTQFNNLGNLNREVCTLKAGTELNLVTDDSNPIQNSLSVALNDVLNANTFGRGWGVTESANLNITTTTYSPHCTINSIAPVNFGPVDIPTDTTGAGSAFAAKVQNVNIPVSCSAGTDGTAHTLQWSFTGTPAVINGTSKNWLLGTSLKRWFIYGHMESYNLTSTICNTVSIATSPNNRQWVVYDGAPLTGSRTIAANSSANFTDIAYGWALCYATQSDSASAASPGSSYGSGTAQAMVTIQVN